MITTANLQKVLHFIGFTKQSIGEFYTKDFGTCQMAVDVDNQKLIYPEDKGLVVNDKTTSNFSHPENFVVFECVCRLLEKGYRPEHMELEPRWQLGRDGKSGKADIVVKDTDGSVLIIIECKTAGTEYNKEITNTEEYGGQLFSYWQQENATRWLALYASDWKDGEVKVTSQVINCTDDANILRMAEKDKDVLTYRNAKNDKERCEVWKETYGCAWLDNLIFAEKSQAYNIGIPPLLKENLRDFTPEDKIVNRFEEILRHNNVSDKENAFNRLVALFICKLVDEIKKQDFEEVDFQYKQGTDDYETLQDRLQRLHTQGMKEFMREDIFYVKADYAESLFQQYTGSKRKAAIEDLKNTIRILKFYSNNDFAFKDVHNEELFFQNGKILVEVVQLFQPYRIVYPSKHQFLGDLFEQLLNKGFKQDEGQFFTPTPITRFIWDALPLQSYICDHQGLPNVIDYACGAGHFLTEAVEAINAVRKDGNNQWVEKHIYGIEKDYRLARVSKISMFMNGAGGANIIFGDGLENYPDKHIEPANFDILVANPPYSVKAFKQHLKLRNNSFRLLDLLTNDAKEIETLFVERIAQLLRPQGIAAVVLPASILSNGDIYTAAREELLQNFMLHAVVCFGSKTFGATGTNTVTLFLERYNEPPRMAALTHDSVAAIMSGEELTDWSDRQLFEAYIARQGVEAETYRRFLAKELESQEVEQDSYLKIYTDAFSTVTIPYPKHATEEEKAALRRTKFYEFALGVEQEKLYYFALALPQNTVVITAPTDNKEQKTFLGYDWIGGRRRLGITINKPGGKLYNEADRFARGTLACAVRNSFEGAYTTLPEDEAKYAATYHLADMMDFSRASFNKAISTTAKTKTVQLTSKWPMVKLGEVAIITTGNSAPQGSSAFTNGTYPFFRTSDVGKEHLSKDLRNSADFLNETGIRGMRLFKKGTILLPKTGMSTYKDHRAIMGVDGYVVSHLACIIADTKKVLIDYLYEVLVLIKAKDLKNDSGYPTLNTTDIENISIPLPHFSVQQQIVAECEKVDEEYNTSRMTVETYRKKIADLFEQLEVINRPEGGVKLIDLCAVINPSKSEVSSLDGNTKVSFIEMASLSNNGFIVHQDERRLSDVFKGSYTYFKEGDVILAKITPCMENGKCALAKNLINGIGFGSSEYHVFRTNDRVLNEFLFAFLNRDVVREAAAKVMTGSSGHRRVPISFYENIMVPLPSLATQQKIANEINDYNEQIAIAQSVMEACAGRKRAVLDKYLQ